MNFFKSKKAQGNVYIAIPIMLAVYGIFFIICYLVLSSLMTQMAASSYWDANMELAANKFLGALRILDFIMVLLTIVLIVGIGVTTYRLATPPLFFIINFIAGAFYGFLAYFMSYFFQSFASNALFTATLAYFPRTVLICTNLHWVILVALIVGSISLFGKKPRGQYLE